MLRCRHFSSHLWVTALLLAAAVVLSAGYLADRRSLEQPPEIVRIEVADDAAAVPTLTVSGRHLDRSLNAVIIPNPALDEGDPRALTPHLALFQLDTEGALAVASARGQRIVSIDIRSGEPPRLLGSLEIGKKTERSKGITALLKLGNHAVASLGGGRGLVLLDIADPTALRKLDELPLPGSLTDMLAVNDRIVAAGARSGLWQIRIEDDRLRVERIPGAEQAWRLAGAGNRVVAASLDGELALFEVAKSSGLRLVGRTRIPGEIRGVTMNGKALHLCLADGVLREYSISRWPQLVPRGELQLPGRPLRLVRDDNRPLLICSLVGVGAALIDTARPGQPAVAGWLATNAPIADLAVVGDRLVYVNSNGLTIRRIDSLLSQTQLSVDFPLEQRREKIQLFAWDGEPVMFDHERAIVLGRNRPEPAREPASVTLPVLIPGRNELRLLARREGGLVATGALPVAGTVNEVLVRDGFLYVLTDTAVEIFAWGTDGVGKKLGRLAGFTGVRTAEWLAPEFLLVVERSGELKLVSVRDAAAPRLVAEKVVPAFLKDAGGGSYDVVVSGQRAYVARGVLGIEVLDVTVPEQLRTLQLLDTPGRAQSLALHGALLLANDRGRGIQVIETRGEQCRLLGTIKAPGQIESLVPIDDELLVNSAVGAVSRLPAPALLGELAPAASGDKRFTLPAGLPNGSYQLVLYNDRHHVRADFALP